MHLLSTKEGDSTSVSDGSHTKEELDPSQLDFVVLTGNCIADQQPSHSVFKFASVGRNLRASHHQMSISRRPHTRSMTATSRRRRSNWFTNRFNVCRSHLQSGRKRKIMHTSPDIFPNPIQEAHWIGPPEAQLGLTSFLQGVQGVT